MHTTASAILAILLLSNAVFGQNNVRIDNTCSAFHGQTVPVGKADEEVKGLVIEIVGLTELNPDFGIYSSELLDNVAATEDENGKILIHNPSLFNLEKDPKNFAATIAICQQLFTLIETEEQKSQRTCQEKAIEADRFAGHILQKMGASADDVRSAMDKAIATPTLKLQPHAEKRMEAIMAGWQATKEMQENEAKEISQTALEIPLGPDVSNPKAIRLNKHLILKRTGYPILQESWNSGYKINESVWVDRQWYVVMTPKGTDFLSQAMRLREKFPESDIKSLWDDKHDITRVEYYNHNWFLCMTKTTGSVLQRWRTRYEFPEKEITKSWNQGYYIIDMAYGDSLYALILDRKPADYKSQTWYRRTLFPEKEIEEHWAKGEMITLLKYLNGRWVLVMTKFTDPKKQRYFITNTFPLEIIRQQESEGYIIKGLNYGPDQWTLVMEKQ